MLKLSHGEVEGHTVEELGDALAAKAAELEAQLQHSKCALLQRVTRRYGRAGGAAAALLVRALPSRPPR